MTADSGVRDDEMGVIKKYLTTIFKNYSGVDVQVGATIARHYHYIIII